MYETKLWGHPAYELESPPCSSLFIDFLSPKLWAPKKAVPSKKNAGYPNPTAHLPSCETNAIAMTLAEGHSGRVCPCTPWNRPATPSELSTLLAWCEGSHHRHGGS